MGWRRYWVGAATLSTLKNQNDDELQNEVDATHFWPSGITLGLSSTWRPLELSLGRDSAGVDEFGLANVVCLTASEFRPTQLIQFCFQLADGSAGNKKLVEKRFSFFV